MSKEKLLEILSDKSARDDERDDAAIDLGCFDGNDVKNVLFQVANDLRENEMIRASCGESLAQIWIRNNYYDIDYLLILQDIAKVEALAIIKADKPTWYQEYLEKK